MSTNGKSRRGFASLDPAKARAIASQGGKAAHAAGRAHEFTTEEARVAGRKGVLAAIANGTHRHFTSAEARKAGRKGGQATKRRRKAGRHADVQAPAGGE
jgi:general stress protein YciG